MIIKLFLVLSLAFTSVNLFAGSKYECESVSNPVYYLTIDKNNGVERAQVKDLNGEILIDTEVESVSKELPGSSSQEPPNVLVTWTSSLIKVVGTFTPALPSRNFSASAIWSGQNEEIQFSCIF